MKEILKVYEAVESVDGFGDFVSVNVFWCWNVLEAFGEGGLIC